MTSKKYEFSKAEVKIIKGRTLFRIRALIDIPFQHVKAGDFGGFIEKEENLSHEGNAWVAQGSAVYGSGMISRNALIAGEAIVSDSNVYGDVEIKGRAQVSHSTIKGSGLNIMGDALVENVDIEVEKGFIIGKTTLKNVFGRNKLTLFTMQGNARIVGQMDRHMLMGGDNISISGNAHVVFAYAILGSSITIEDDVSVEEGVTIHGKKIHLSDYARIVGRVTLRDNLSVSELGHVCSPQGTSQVGNMKISGDAVVDACSL